MTRDRQVGKPRCWSVRAVERDLACLWHPYTPMKDCQQWPPRVIERAEGLKLYTSDGHWIYDTLSSWWCNVHGHNHPVLMQALRSQTERLDHVLFAGFTHRGAIELAERLVTLTPEPLTRVFYSDDGSTAVEAALKMSLQYWLNVGRPEKRRFVGFDRGYHGDTVGAMSVVGPSLFNRAYRALMVEQPTVPAPDCGHCPAGRQRGHCDLECLEPLERLLAAEHASLAGVILEPLLMGAGGMIVYPAEAVTRIAEWTRRYDLHLILDEVATGFGRTGTMFACEQAAVAPDFLCLSKGLTGGTLPLAATLTTETVYQAFYDDALAFKTFYHGHTFTANPLACAVALASLDLFEQQCLLERIRPRIEQLRAGLAGLQDERFVANVRCLGLVGALDLVQDRETGRPFDPALRLGPRLFAAGIEQHLLIRPLGDVVYLFLPLCTTEAELADILDRFAAVLRQTVTTL